MTKCEKCGAEYDEGQEHTCASEEPSAVERLDALIDKIEKRDQEREQEIERRVNQAVAALGKDKEPETPSKTTEPGPRIQIFDRFDELGYSRGDFEFAMMMIHGARKIANPVLLTPPEDLVKAWTYHCFEAPRDVSGPIGKRNHGTRIFYADADDNPVEEMTPQRAMDTAESGYGAEIIGAQYVRDLWEAARNMDGLVGRIRDMPMADPTVYVPIDGDLPEMLFVGESTTYDASAYATSKTGSNRVSLAAKKFTIQQIWSAELDEDSIIAFAPFLRERLNMSAALYLGSAYYNGDTVNTATGNINSDDADPADTKHYLAWDGIRKYWLVTASGQGADMAGALDVKEIDIARAKLNAGDDDVDALIKNINWGQRAADLLIVCDFDTYIRVLLDRDEVVTVDKYGAQATIVTGELGRFKGIPIVTPSYASKTEADGKASGTETNNTKGQISVLNPAGFLGGNRRAVQLFFDRIQRTDQFLFELYTRRAFTRFGGNVAAGIYDITV